MHTNIPYTHIDVQKKIKKDIVYLNDFYIKSSHENENGCFWRYMYQTQNKSYKVLCVICRSKKNIWSMKICVYWLKLSKNVTAGKGKDFEYEIPSCTGYNDFIKKANIKLKNNPILHTKIYDDDYSFDMDREIIKMIIELIKKFPEMDSLNFNYYSELKKIYYDVINKSNKEILQYIKNKYPGSTEKQFLILKLDTLKSVDNFHRMNKMKLNPKI